MLVILQPVVVVAMVIQVLGGASNRSGSRISKASSRISVPAILRNAVTGRLALLWTLFDAVCKIVLAIVNS